MGLGLQVQVQSKWQVGLHRELLRPVLAMSRTKTSVRKWDDVNPLGTEMGMKAPRCT